MMMPKATSESHGAHQTVVAEQVAEPPSPSPPPPLLLELMGEIHHLPMVVVRNHHDRSSIPPIIFPPINHENLHVPTDPQFSFSDSDSNSSSTFSPPSGSSPSPLSPLFSDPTAAYAAGWLDSWIEILCSKVRGFARSFCSGIASSRGVFLTIRSAALPAVLLAFLYFRRRRKLRAGEESRDRLIGIIKERDEKINQLLDQISRMNQVLLALHKVPTGSTP